MTMQKVQAGPAGQGRAISATLNKGTIDREDYEHYIL